MGCRVSVSGIDRSSVVSYALLRTNFVLLRCGL